MAENKEDAVYYSDGEIHFVVTNIVVKILYPRRLFQI